MDKFVMVDKETCLACGACASIEERLFGVDKEGLAHVLLDNNTGTKPVAPVLHENLDEAVRFCATDSIKISHSPFYGDANRFEKK